MKKKLLYASPFPPMKSGISDYSEVLVDGLKEHYDITLLVDDYKLENRGFYGKFEMKNPKQSSLRFGDYDHILYNIGNNPYFHAYIYDAVLRYPGTLILHDYILYFLTVGYYSSIGSLYSKVYELEGARGINILKSCAKKNRDLLACKTVASSLPMNSEIIRASRGVLVHSEFTKNMLQGNFPGVKAEKIDMVNMHAVQSSPDKDYLKKQYGVEDDAMVVCSFGYITESKLNHIVCDVIDGIADSGVKIYYVMAGEGNYVNQYLKRNIIKTGYVKRSIYDAILERSDIVVNLRYPSMGETSISLIHAMGLGKPCIVSDYAWFGELPDEAVIKIDVSRARQGLHEAMHKLLSDGAARTRYAGCAKEYVARNNKVEKIARDIHAFLETSIQHDFDAVPRMGELR